ncbi:hypothetical protein ACFX2F_032030 [Malus domestica]
MPTGYIYYVNGSKRPSISTLLGWFNCRRGNCIRQPDHGRRMRWLYCSTAVLCRGSQIDSFDIGPQTHQRGRTNGSLSPAQHFPGLLREQR